MLVILDRDGVINHDSAEYIKSPDEWQPIPGALEAIAKLNQAGHQVVVATNQSGVARGYFSEEILQQIHLKMQEALAALGGHFEGIYYCPHGPDDNCECRKPKAGMLQQILQDFPVEVGNTILVGDSLRDIEAAYAVGMRAVLVKTGKGAATVLPPAYSDALTAADLAEAVEVILRFL